MLLLSFGVIASQAQRTSVYQGTSASTRQLLRRIETRVDLLRNSLNSRSTRNGAEATTVLNDFSSAVRQLRQSSNRDVSSPGDVQSIFDRANAVDNFITQRGVDSRSRVYWSDIRTDLNELARTYGVTWVPSSASYPTRDDGSYRNPPERSYGSRRGLTGTYRLDAAASETVANVVDRALRSVPYQQRQQRRDQLMRRLDPPDQIAIDVRGQSVTLASTRAPQVTFDADGRERVETTPNGRTIRVRSALNGDQLTVTTTGDRDNQFNVTFFPLENGRRLRVTRRVYSESLQTPIEIQSFYNRSGDVAELNIYTGPSSYPTNDTNTGDFILRNGETVTATLDTPLSTRTSRDGDRFTATVQSPSEYAGATIDGHVSSIERSGRVTGRAQMTLNFDNIRLRNGRSYSYAGFLQSVRLSNGDTVNIDNEGAVREDNQSTKTIQRAAIGTAIGAIIGAIAGGGKGAAIGAAVGAGGGAGSVYVQGRDDLDLMQGTELTIQTTGPR